MRYWLLQDRKPEGPYTPEALVALPGFDAGWMICLEGDSTDDRTNWKPARKVQMVIQLMQGRPSSGLPFQTAPQQPQGGIAPTESAPLGESPFNVPPPAPAPFAQPALPPMPEIPFPSPIQAPHPRPPAPANAGSEIPFRVPTQSPLSGPSAPSPANAGPEIPFRVPTQSPLDRAKTMSPMSTPMPIPAAAIPPAAKAASPEAAPRTQREKNNTMIMALLAMTAVIGLGAGIYAITMRTSTPTGKPGATTWPPSNATPQAAEPR